MEKNSFFIGTETKNKEMTHTEKLSSLAVDKVVAKLSEGASVSKK